MFLGKQELDQGSAHSLFLKGLWTISVFYGFILYVLLFKLAWQIVDSELNAHCSDWLTVLHINMAKEAVKY